MKQISAIVLVVVAIAAAAAIFVYDRSNTESGFIVKYPITQVVYVLDMQSPPKNTEFNYQTPYEGYSTSTDYAMPLRLVFKKIMEENASYLEIWQEEGVEAQRKGRIQLSANDPELGGFSTLDIITLTFNGNTPEPTIQLMQTSIPGDGDDMMMPGPPEVRSYRSHGGSYRLMAAN